MSNVLGLQGPITHPVPTCAPDDILPANAHTRRSRGTPGPTHCPAGLAAPPTKRCDDEGLWAPCTIRTWRSTPCRAHSTCTVGTSTVLLRGGGDVPPEFPTLARPSLRCSRAHRSAAVAADRASRHRRCSAGVASSTWARPDHSAGVASVSKRASRQHYSPAPRARARVPWAGKQLPPECLRPALAPRPRPCLLAPQTATL